MLWREYCRHTFSKVLSIVPLLVKCTRILTFENLCCRQYGETGAVKVCQKRPI